ncbi:MAG: class I SAM-dependent methyltransferase [Halieaceae bacterium]|jgi:predicted methyltransferase|nr:class I SAM-dependent methyltransferase [Halieaceae bacterium]
MKYLRFALLIALSNMTVADDFDAVETQLKAAMAAESRSEAETARDSNRRPIETLKFFGLRDSMTIVELIPGGGWYTKLLAPVVRDKGTFYAALGTSRVSALAKESGFEHIKITAEDSKIYRKEGARLYTIETEGLEVKNADMVLTFRNYHNFDADGRAAMNKAAYDALKSGGIYAVVDHTRRHMESDTPENRRRIDPVLAIKEIQAAGFKLVDFATLHYRADDELRYEVGRKTVTGNTDRWSLKFVK